MERLKEIAEIYYNCPLKSDEMPGESQKCKECSLHKSIYEHSEHPTFCEELIEIEIQWRQMEKYNELL